MTIFGYTLIKKNELDKLLIEYNDVKIDNHRLSMEVSDLKIDLRTAQMLLDIETQNTRMHR